MLIIYNNKVLELKKIYYQIIQVDNNINEKTKLVVITLTY